MQGAAQWINLRLACIASFIMFVTAILLIAFRNQIHSSSIALSLMYTISLSIWLQWTIRQLIEADIMMNSADRIDEYAQLPPEEDQGGYQRLVKTSPNWPDHGAVEFRNYSLSHRTGLDLVLKNINLSIKPGEKIGVIGRTGAGKSSLFKGLFRFIHRSNTNGQILIDNIDISRVTLNHLRSNLSIIPQQPILFSGTLRYNLDPFNHYSDEQCWMALEDIQLKSFVSHQPAGLLMPIAESGGNLSVGQCQLICIARAILKKSQILLIDEATANVDEKTDDIIQEVFTNKFQDRTVLTIAHRLNTVAKCDRILVLDKGAIVNFDTPMNVLEHYQ
jgi:ABC-type multidrug transport system fused ATPase/permease subunit